jgi:hypothetical protein
MPIGVPKVPYRMPGDFCSVGRFIAYTERFMSKLRWWACNQLIALL